jgi:hypothetical protein
MDNNRKDRDNHDNYCRFLDHFDEFEEEDVTRRTSRRRYGGQRDQSPQRDTPSDAIMSSLEPLGTTTAASPQRPSPVKGKTAEVKEAAVDAVLFGVAFICIALRCAFQGDYFIPLVGIATLVYRFCCNCTTKQPTSVPSLSKFKVHMSPVLAILLAFFFVLLGMLLQWGLFSGAHHCNNDTVSSPSPDNCKAENKPTPTATCNSILYIADNKTLKGATEFCNKMIADNVKEQCNTELDEQKMKENTDLLDDTNRVTHQVSLHHTTASLLYYLRVLQDHAMGALGSAAKAHDDLTTSHALSIEYSKDGQITPSARSYDAGVQTVQHMYQAEWQSRAHFVLHVLVPIVSALTITVPTVGGPIAAVKAIKDLGGLLATVNHIWHSYKLASGVASVGASVGVLWDIGGWAKGRGTTFLNWYNTKITAAAKGTRCVLTLGHGHNECIDDLNDKGAVSTFTKKMSTEISSDHLSDIIAFTSVMQTATKAICRQTPIGKQVLLNLLVQYNTSKTKEFYDKCVSVLESKLQENRANWLTMGNITEKLPMTFTSVKRRMLSSNSVGEVSETCKRLSKSPLHVLQPWFQSYQQIIEDVSRVKRSFYDDLNWYDVWKHDESIQNYKKHLDKLAQLKICDPEQLSALLHNASSFDIARRSIPEMVVGTDYMDSDLSVVDGVMDFVKQADLVQIFASLGVTTEDAREKAMNIEPILFSLNATVQKMELTPVQQERVGQLLNVLPSEHVDIHGKAVQVSNMLSTIEYSLPKDSWLTWSGKVILEFMQE